jgi:ribosome-binding factor A
MGKRDTRRTRGPRPGGIDPSEFTDSRFDRKTERKTQQLCREVRDALSISLAALDDEALAEAWVAEVLPGADSSHLRVVVVTTADLEATYEALRRAAGLLRSEVAAAISRKRTPLLSFEVHQEVAP